MRRPLRFVAVSFLVGLGGCVATATFAASSHSSARTAATCPIARFRAAPSLTGIADLSYVHTATGDVPGARRTEKITLERSLRGAELTLTRMRTSVPGILLYSGRGRGGVLTIDDSRSYSKGGPSGALKGGDPPTFVGATAAFALAQCKAWFFLTYSGRGSYSGAPGLRPASTTVGGNALSFPDPSPGGKAFTGLDPVPAVHSGCNANPWPLPTEGCYFFSGSWTNDFVTLAHCKSVVTESCAPADEPIGQAQLSWSLKPSFK